jgi:hypothetical protein
MPEGPIGRDRIAGEVREERLSTTLDGAGSCRKQAVAPSPSASSSTRRGACMEGYSLHTVSKMTVPGSM